VENAGKSRENAIFPADFLPGACRTGFEVNRGCRTESFRAETFGQPALLSDRLLPY
jgi:hypothetical protein